MHPSLQRQIDEFFTDRTDRLEVLTDFVGMLEERARRAAELEVESAERYAAEYQRNQELELDHGN